MQSMKTCVDCGETKPLEDFHKTSAKSGLGRQTRCKPCATVKNREWRKANPEVKAWKARWEAAHREQHLAGQRVRTRRRYYTEGYKAYRQAWLAQNGDSVAAYQKEYRRKVGRWKQIEKKYGLTKAAYEDIEAAQAYRCPICQRLLADAQVHIDHCHDTDKVRGLLCQRCNQAIGLLKHEPLALLRACRYLRRP